MKTVDYILKLIYPQRCVFCGELLNLNSREAVCEKCGNIGRLEYKTCILCRRELENKSNPICGKCMSKLGVFSDGISLYKYKDVRDAILSFKYSGMKRRGIAFGKIMGYAVKDSNTRLITADVIIPVPISRERFKERGYNQSDVLAKEISKEIGTKYISDMLIRTKNTVPQNSLNEIERRMNVFNAFKLNEKYNVEGKKIIIVDDIFTTGSTLNECGKTLKKAGAEELFYLTLAKTEI